jgi:anaerobic selenocysteine-containing dehydrogenase
MVADPAADFGSIMAATLVQLAVLIAARRSFVFGLGMTQQQQTAHGAISIRFKSGD